MRACFAKKDPKWDCHKWAHETPNIKKLPMKKKSYGGKIDHSRRKCMNCGGKMQAGGSYGIPKREDYPDQRSYENALEEYYVGPSVNTRSRSYAPINMPQQAAISDSDFLPEEQYKPSGVTPNQGVLEPKRVDDIDAQANQMYNTGDKQYQQGYDKDLGMSVMDNGTASEKRSYRNFYRGKYGQGINPVDPFQVGLGVEGLKGVFSWLGEKKNRRAQNKYMYNQYSTLGQNDAVPVSNFQPTPYNLYAKLGGNLKRYMFTNNAENKNFPVDAGKMQQGGLTPSYHFPAYNYDVSQLGRAEYERLFNNAVSDTSYFDRTQVQPAWGSYASATSTRPQDIQEQRLQYALLRQNILEDAKDKLKQQRSQQEYNQFSAFPVSKKPLQTGGFPIPMAKRMKFKNVNFFGAPQPPLFDPMNSLTSMIGTQNEDFMSVVQGMKPEFKRGGNWIQSAVNPEHKGYCTPMTKSTCTGRRRALAETFKKHHGFHKKK